MIRFYSKEHIEIILDVIVKRKYAKDYMRQFTKFSIMLMAIRHEEIIFNTNKNNNESLVGLRGILC